VSASALVGLDVAGDADAWRAAGFAVDADGACRLGHVRMQTGVGETGISNWVVGDAATVEPATHPNGAILLDHLVVFTDDPDRTIAAYAERGLEVRRVRACSAAVAGVLLAGTAASKTRTIIIENLHFDPQTLTVKSGDRITWVNKDLFPHTATADSKIFDSQGIAPNASWVFVAGKPGTYTYACAFHPTMKGTVTVQ